jgi:thymidylate synthase (FAD)
MSGHGRVEEYPQIYLQLDGYSARVIREFYTHIGGAPTRLQESTRYVDCSSFGFVIPPSILENGKANYIYQETMRNISEAIKALEDLGIKREDSAMLLPLGMETKVIVRTNLRNLIDMSHQRLCTRAYWEFRQLMKDIINALAKYSEEWEILIDYDLFVPKCQVYGYCPEKNSCGRRPKKEVA